MIQFSDLNSIDNLNHDLHLRTCDQLELDKITFESEKKNIYIYIFVILNELMEKMNKKISVDIYFIICSLKHKNTI